MWSRLFGGAKGAGAPVFSVASLVALHDTLLHARSQGAMASPQQIVESVRQIGEMLVYGDQRLRAGELDEQNSGPLSVGGNGSGSGGNERYLEVFCERRMLGTFVTLFRDAHVLNCWAGVAVQVLQTVSILLINAARSATLFFLLSNNHVNDLIESPFDETDEELLGYYISLLKTLSAAFGSGGASTLQFFFLAAPRLKNASAAAALSTPPRDRFPLYTSSVHFCAAEDGMVRTATRQIVLNVLRARDAGVRAFLLAGGGCDAGKDLASLLVHSFVRTLHAVNAALTAVLAASGSGAESTLDDAWGTLVDEVLYLGDVLALEDEESSPSPAGPAAIGIRRITEGIEARVIQLVLEGVLLPALFGPPPLGEPGVVATVSSAPSSSSSHTALSTTTTTTTTAPIHAELALRVLGLLVLSVAPTSPSFARAVVVSLCRETPRLLELITRPQASPSTQSSGIILLHALMQLGLRFLPLATSLAPTASAAALEGTRATLHALALAGLFPERFLRCELEPQEESKSASTPPSPRRPTAAATSSGGTASPARPRAFTSNSSAALPLAPNPAVIAATLSPAGAAAAAAAPGTLRGRSKTLASPLPEGAPMASFRSLHLSPSSAWWKQDEVDTLAATASSLETDSGGLFSPSTANDAPVSNAASALPHSESLNPSAREATPRVQKRALVLPPLAHHIAQAARGAVAASLVALLTAAPCTQPASIANILVPAALLLIRITFSPAGGDPAGGGAAAPRFPLPSLAAAAAQLATQLRQRLLGTLGSGDFLCGVLPTVLGIEDAAEEECRGGEVKKASAALLVGYFKPPPLPPPQAQAALEDWRKASAVLKRLAEDGCKLWAGDGLRRFAEDPRGVINATSSVAPAACAVPAASGGAQTADPLLEALLESRKPQEQRRPTPQPSPGDFYLSSLALARHLCLLRAVLRAGQGNALPYLCARVYPPGQLPPGLLPPPTGPAAAQPPPLDPQCASDDLLSNVWTGEDGAVRDLSPPLNSIRAGDTLSVATLPWLEGVVYPVCMEEFPSPLSAAPAPPPGSASHAAVQAAEARASGALGEFISRVRSGGIQGRRAAVVLGRSYIVISEFLPSGCPGGSSSGGSNSSSSGGAALAPRKRARALVVLPLHCTFVAPAAQAGAANIVDVRALLRAPPDAGAAQGLAVEPVRLTGQQSLGASQDAPPFLRGFTLAFASSDSSAELASHVDLSRTKVLKAHLATLQQLEKYYLNWAE